MGMRPPSWGFTYLAAMLVICAAFFVCVNGTTWFDESDPQDRLRSESQYLYRLAANSTGTPRLRWMNAALPLFFGLADGPEVLVILDELNEARVEPQLDPGTAVVPDAAWAAGLTADRWTLGTQAALFVAHNAKSAPAELVLHWRAPAEVERARFRRGRGDWQALAFSQVDGESLTKLTIPLPPASPFELISVAAVVTHSPKGDPRPLGIHLDHVEWRP